MLGAVGPGPWLRRWGGLVRNSPDDVAVALPRFG
jgi:hypothetical protein